jgi:RNA polymerase sigma-70 factor (ECF subfamily)
LRDTAPVDESPDPLDDVVEQAGRGDEAAFRIVWRSLQPALLRYLQVAAGDEADDLASETWAQAVRDLHRFRGGGMAFRGWLFTIARHRAIDAARRRGRLRRNRGDSGQADVVPVSPSAEDESAVKFSTRDAIALVAALPPRQAEAVSLRIIAGLDTATAASIAGTSLEALRVNLHRGLRALAQHPKLLECQEAIP